MSANDPEPRRVYFRPPDDWDRLTEAEQLAWAEELLELMLIERGGAPRPPSWSGTGGQEGSRVRRVW